MAENEVLENDGLPELNLSAFPLDDEDVAPDTVVVDTDQDGSVETKEVVDEKKEVVIPDTTPPLPPGAVSQDQFNNLIGLVTKTTVANEQLQRELLEMKESKIVPPEKPVFSQTDYDTNSEEVVEKKIKYQDDLKTFEQDKQKIETQKETATMQQRHNADWAAQQAAIPLLRTQEGMESWNRFYNNPQGNYKQTDDGVMRATIDFINSSNSVGVNPYAVDITKPIMDQVNGMMNTFRGGGAVDNSQQQVQQQQIQPGQQQMSPAQQQADDIARKVRAGGADMQIDQGGKPNSFTPLNKKQKAAAEMFGVSDEAYARNVVLVGGGKKNG